MTEGHTSFHGSGQRIRVEVTFGLYFMLVETSEQLLDYGKEQLPPPTSSFIYFLSLNHLSFVALYSHL